MKLVFKGEATKDQLADFFYKKAYFYGILEQKASTMGLLRGMDSLRRTGKLYDDYDALVGKENPTKHFHNLAIIEYHNYLLNLGYARDIMAHIYVWHMGDLYGGQFLKKIYPDVQFSSLEFDNPDELRTKIRAKLNDDMAYEANRAFDWAIRILESMMA